MLKTPCTAEGKRQAQVEVNLAVPYVIPEEINPPIYPVMTISLDCAIESVDSSYGKCPPLDPRDGFIVLLSKIQCKT